MTTQLVVLYTAPADPGDFDRHYLEVHGPLVDQVPGLQSWNTARFAGPADGGEPTYHRIATLYFADQAALEAGLASEQGKAAAEDYQRIAPPGSRMFIATVDK